MAVSYPPEINDLSTEDNEMSEQAIAQDLDAQKNRERFSSRVQDALKDKAKDELWKQTKKGVRKTFGKPLPAATGAGTAGEAGAVTGLGTGAGATGTVGTAAGTTGAVGAAGGVGATAATATGVGATAATATTAAAGVATTTAVAGTGATVAVAGGVTTSPIWITLGIIILVLIFLFFMAAGAIAAVYYACNEAQGSTVIKAISYAGSWVGQTDVCAEVGKFNASNSGDIQQPTQASPPPGTDLVAIGSRVPVEGVSDPRLRECMLVHIEIIRAKAKTLGIDFVITSAYRPGALVGSTGRLSAHGKGEAVDIALRPKGAVTDVAFMKKVRDVVGISLAEGFKYPAGNTLDEYSDPTEDATGGHIHIEYNTAPNGGSYCTLPTYHDKTD